MSKAVVNCGWDDVPHIDEAEAADLLAATPPHLRDARSKGIPSMGVGMVYSVPEEQILIDPFFIPPYWPKAYGFDVGWRRTAALFGAKDPSTGMLYLYDEHYRGEAEPIIHATAIKRRAGVPPWMWGAIDPASRGRSQRDGKQLLHDYRAEPNKLKLILADNTLESSVYDLWNAFSTGQIKVFRTLMSFRAEYRIYRRDKNGKIVSENDHLMDCLRYLWSKLDAIARVTPHRLALPGQGLVQPFQPIDPEVGF